MIDATLSALSYSFVHLALARDEVTGRQAGAARFNRVARFVARQADRLPDHLRPPFRVAAVVFDLAGFIHFGRLFHQVEPERRLRQIELWADSPIRAMREFVRFFESLATLAYYADRTDAHSQD